jgi:hypothetical protein
LNVAYCHQQTSASFPCPVLEIAERVHVIPSRRAAAGFRAEPCSAAEGEQWQSRQHNRYEPAAGVSCIRKQTEADASAIKTLPEFNSGDLSMI